MAQVDVIVAWPRNCDFPLWRRFIADERARFGQVFIVWTEHDGDDYSAFVGANFQQATFLPSPARGDRDWRDVAVNAALDRSTAEWVWFTEQDLIVTAPTFWPDFTADAYGFWEQNGRWHPASLFARRADIDRTSRYFGPEPIDHFWTFSNELDQLAHVQSLTDFEHLQGTAENHRLIEAGIDAGIFDRPRFREFLRASLASGVPIHPRWEATARQEIG